MITGRSLASPNARLLVVEDEALIAEELRERLTHLGYDVVGVEDSGEAAIEAVLRGHPDLVLMDVRLKGTLDGIDAARSIREHLDVPVVYLTAHSDASTIERAKVTTPAGYILKPFQERDLRVTIDMALHRDHMDRRLRESEKRYAATLASIGDAVLAIDARGCITFVNPVAEALTGWPREEALGRDVDDVFVLHDEDSGMRLTSPLRTALKGGRRLSLDKEALLRCRDGTFVPVDDSAAPILLSDHEIAGAVIAFRDVRDRRLAREAVERAREQVERAQKMESIGRLAAGVAHDFNNLLSIILGCTSLLDQVEELPEAARSAVGEIRQTGERAAELVDRLLTFGRKRPIHPAALDLNALALALDPLIRRLVGRHVLVAFDLADHLPQVFVDAPSIEQAILNLVANARDAMPDGGRLVLRTRLVEGQRDGAGVFGTQHAVLEVEDEGMGMDEATRSQIFEPFFTTKGPDFGTGLGLATVYSAVAQSGGVVDVTSELGNGSRFDLHLPLSRDRERLVLSEELRSARAQRTVLLVDDDEPLRKILARGLATAGFDVVDCGDAERALHVHGERGRVDVLVTDYGMPGMNGLEFGRILRGRQRDLKVVLASGVDPFTPQGPVLPAPFVFLAKPFTLARLCEVLDQLCEEDARAD